MEKNMDFRRVLTEAEEDVLRAVFMKGVLHGRSTPGWPRWIIFLIGLSFGIAWSLMVMHNMGVFNK